MRTELRTYFDHNATTPLHPAARAAMLTAFDLAGNPSSVHAEGRAARDLIERSRRVVAGVMSALPQDVYFTSGGTEALNIVLTPELSVRGRKPSRLLVGGGEHPAVLKGHRFEADRVEIVPLRSSGELDLDALEQAIGGEPVLLALQAANNETGVIQPVEAAARLVHQADGFVVCDAVQATGKVPLGFIADADAVALSGHKFGAPKGIGALCLRTECQLPRGVVSGGGQERGLRAGTENVLGIAGLAAAIEAAADCVAEESERLCGLRNRLERHLGSACRNVVVFGRSAPRLPNTSCFAIPDFDAQIFVANLDLEGVAVSAGSACSSGKAAGSHVLASMGVGSDLATRMVRVSLGWSTTTDDVDSFVAALGSIVQRMRPRVAA